MTIRALTCDTGGTILDWHTGLRSTFAAIGAERGIEGDWAKITNEYRRRSLEGMVDAVRPERNIDEVNRRVLDLLCPECGLAEFADADKDRIARTWHALDAWPDCPAAMKRLRTKHQVVALTILTTALVIDVSRKNSIDWDCVISCEMIGIYKRRPEAYKTAAKWLQIDPSEIMMVAAHNSDLLAARACGFRSEFILCAAACNVRIMEADIDDVPWKDDLLTEPLEIANGQLTIPQKPGWGADLNEREIQKHPWPKSSGTAYA